MKTIAFEGIDGAGKSTQKSKLFDRLNQEGHAVSLYDYSSKNNLWGGFIKKLYSEESRNPLKFIGKSRYVQELLYSLSARSNFNSIKGELRVDSLVLADRSIITAYASHIDRLPKWFVGIAELSLFPDVAVYLDISPEEALQRIGERDVKFQDENLEELIYFRECYERIMDLEKPRSLESTRFIRIEATLPKDEISDKIYEEIRRELR